MCKCSYQSCLHILWSLDICLIFELYIHQHLKIINNTVSLEPSTSFPGPLISRAGRRETLGTRLLNHKMYDAITFQRFILLHSLGLVVWSWDRIEKENSSCERSFQSDYLHETSSKFNKIIKSSSFRNWCDEALVRFQFLRNNRALESPAVASVRRCKFVYTSSSGAPNGSFRWNICSEGL